MRHREQHRSERIGWLRAAVLGANDGIVSTASLVVGVAAAEANPQQVLVAGVAGLVAGALSMAAGEYVSVSSQADTERADIKREKGELATQPQAEEDELTGIYARRGLEPELARTVARQLMAKDALGAHARDELGLTAELAARPLQAALASAATFAVGAGYTGPHHPARAREPPVARCLDRVADLSGCARRDRGTRGRRAGRDRHRACCVLGGARDGHNRGHRKVVRDGGRMSSGAVSAARANGGAPKSR